MRIVLIFLLLCSPALAHDASRPELNEWFNKLASGRATSIGNQRTATIASALRISGSMFPTTP